MILTEKDLNHGDHIYVKRKRLLYSHHGIYAGEGTVIHYKGAEKEKKELEESYKESVRQANERKE